MRRRASRRLDRAARCGCRLGGSRGGRGRRRVRLRRARLAGRGLSTRGRCCRAGRVRARRSAGIGLRRGEGGRIGC